MLVPEKCGSAPEMDGVSELPDGFREATITCLEFINEVREAGRRREKKSTRHDWRVETLGSCIDRRSCIEPLCPSCGGEGRKKRKTRLAGWRRWVRVSIRGSCIVPLRPSCGARSVLSSSLLALFSSSSSLIDKFLYTTCLV